MKTILSAIATFALAATTVTADTNNFQGIISDAAKIQQDAEAISGHLKVKNPDVELVKSKSGDLNKDIQSLRDDLAAFEANSPDLTAQQKKDWELVKTKAELLLIFSNKKNGLLENGDMQKNRSTLRAYSDAIAKRAMLLQQTARKLDR
jgi:hypothetical protein